MISMLAGQLHLDDVIIPSIKHDLQSSSWIRVQRIGLNMSSTKPIEFCCPDMSTRKLSLQVQKLSPSLYKEDSSDEHMT